MRASGQTGATANGYASGDTRAIDSTPMSVAFTVALALAVLIAFKYAGFRFSMGVG